MFRVYLEGVKSKCVESCSRDRWASYYPIAAFHNLALLLLLPALQIPTFLFCYCFFYSSYYYPYYCLVEIAQVYGCREGVLPAHPKATQPWCGILSVQVRCCHWAFCCSSSSLLFSPASLSLFCFLYQNPFFFLLLHFLLLEVMHQILGNPHCHYCHREVYSLASLSANFFTLDCSFLVSLHFFLIF